MICFVGKTKLESELSKFTAKNPFMLRATTCVSEYGDKEDENAEEVAQYTADKPMEIALEKNCAM